VRPQPGAHRFSLTERRIMIKQLLQLSADTTNELIGLCQQHITLTRDVSNYAKDRKRSWLRYEAPLAEYRPWIQANQNPELWCAIQDICNKISFAPELGLASLGGEIKPHRDAFYADWKAIGINLGTTTFGYKQAYPEYRWVPENQLISPPIISLTEMTGGEVFEFNCKNQHWTSNVASDRWSINLWRVSAKARPKFQLL
jgi:hypothetical protein